MKVCVHCFNDIELKQYIISNSTEKGECDYCKNETNSELLDTVELLDFFSEFISIFKLDPSGLPLVSIIQNDWNLFSYETDFQSILADILSSIKYQFLDPLAQVSYIDDIIECTSYWEKLKEEIKWERRFLLKYENLTEELGWDRFFKKSVTLINSDPLFRTRLHYSGDQNEFDKSEMGCPDKSKSTAGRANPQGIPYLYLSKEIETTLYEVRATYLDEVSVGTFLIKSDSEIDLVDFTEVASAFLNIDEIVECAKRIILKRYISADLSKPIRRYDSELEYIPTQFICEFIRFVSGADGILFNSSLYNQGKNIVLFEQDKVECVSVSLYRVTSVVIDSIRL